MGSSTKSFIVRHATFDDIPSLTTIVPRSFHPTNPYILKFLPNTPAIRQWWTAVFTSKLKSPTKSHLLTTASPDNPSHSLGVLSLQLLGASDHGAGFWSAFPATSDHDAASHADVARNLTDARETLMMGRPHFVVELLGVDHETKGLGLGKKLLLRACEVADEAGLPVFVMANASAKGIYQHPEIGFELRDVKVLPGEMQYEEYILMRPARKLDGES